MNDHAAAHARPVALVVEDEALLAMVTEDSLEAEGFKTLVALTETKVLALMPASLNVAVVDIKLNGDHAGQRVIRHLRSRQPKLPIVVVTGYEGVGPEADLRGLGGPTVRLMKPASQTDIIAAVKNVIERDRNGTPPQSGRRRHDQRRATEPAAVA